MFCGIKSYELYKIVFLIPSEWEKGILKMSIKTPTPHKSEFFDKNIENKKRLEKSGKNDLELRKRTFRSVELLGKS